MTALIAAAITLAAPGREPGVCRNCGNFGTGNPESPCPSCGRV